MQHWVLKQFKIYFQISMKNIIRMQIVEGIEQLNAECFQSIVEYRVGLLLIDQKLQSVSF